MADKVNGTTWGCECIHPSYTSLCSMFLISGNDCEISFRNRTLPDEISLSLFCCVCNYCDRILILQFYRHYTTCVRKHFLLRTEGFCWSNVLLLACLSWWQLALTRCESSQLNFPHKTVMTNWSKQAKSWNLLAEKMWSELSSVECLCMIEQLVSAPTQQSQVVEIDWDDPVAR